MEQIKSVLCLLIFRRQKFYWKRKTKLSFLLSIILMIFYMLFLSMALMHLLKSTKIIGIIIVSTLGFVDAICFLLPVLTDVYFYDTLLYWVAFQILANIILLGCLIKEFLMMNGKTRFLYICAVLPLICAFALLLHPVRAVQTTAPVPQPSAQVVQAAVFPPEHMLLGIPVETVSVTMPTQHLLKGRMLHISNAMPLPEGWRPPDALNVLAHTGGQVTCRDHAATLSEDALAALKALFAAALA